MTREKKKIYTPFSEFVLVSGIGSVLACRSDSESYYGFGLWQILPAEWSQGSLHQLDKCL